MVAKKEDDRGFFHLLIVLDQLLNGAVGGAGQRQILRGGVAVAVAHKIARQMHAPVEVVPLLVIARMVLHGHIEHEAILPGLLGRIGELVEPGKVRTVRDVFPDKLVIGVVRGDVVAVHRLVEEVFAVKTQPLIGSHPVPARGLIGVVGGGAHAEDLGGLRQRGSLVGQVELIGHSAGGQERGAATGECLKLYRGGSASGNGSVHHALDGVLRQGVIVGRGVIGECQAVKPGQVGKGLVHNADKVDGSLCIRGAVTGIALILQPGNKLQRLVLRISIRPFHVHISGRDGEVQQKTVAVRPPLLGVDTQRRKHGCEEKEQDIGAPSGAQPQIGPLHPAPPAPAGALPGQQDEEENDKPQNARRAIDIAVRGIIVIARHIGGGAQTQKVDGKQRPPPELEHIVVGQADDKREDAVEGDSPPASAGDEPADKEQAGIPHDVHKPLPRRERAHLILRQQFYHKKADERCGGKEQPQIGLELVGAHQMPQCAEGTAHKGSGPGQSGFTFGQHRKTSQLVTIEPIIPQFMANG